MHFFIFVYSLFSVELRYFFPAIIIFSLIGVLIIQPLTRIIEVKEDKKFITIIFVVLTILPILSNFFIIRYALSKRKDIDKHIENFQIKDPYLYLIAGLEAIDKLDRKQALKYFNSFASSNAYIGKNQIEETLKIMKGEDLKIDDSSLMLLNNHIIKVAKMIQNKDLTKAEKYVNEKWKEISRSYLRLPRTYYERKLNTEISKQIKKTPWDQNIFILLSEDLSECEKICKEFNQIIRKQGSEDIFNCNYKEEIKFRKISKYCKIKKYPDLSNELTEILELENKDLTKAKEKILSLINKYPLYYKFYTEAGNISLLLKDYKSSEEYFKKSLEICPYAEYSYHGLLYIYKEKNNHKELKKIKNKMKEFQLIN